MLDVILIQKQFLLVTLLTSSLLLLTVRSIGRILLIAKEDKELVNTHLSQSLGHLDATDTSEYLYVSILH